MKFKLIIISFTIFFFDSAQAVCVPRNKTTPPPSPGPLLNLRPLRSSPSSSPKAPTSPPKASTPPSSPPKAPAPLQLLPRAALTPLQSPSSAPPSKPDGLLNTVTSALPNAGGGENNPAIQKICGATDYPDVCLTTLGPVAGPASDASAVLGVAIKAGSDLAKTALATAEKLGSECKDNFDDVIYNFQNAADAHAKKDVGTLNTMLSAALTDVGDCQDALEGQNSPLTTISDTLKKMASNCLAIVEQMNK